MTYEDTGPTWAMPDEDCMPECREAQPAGFGGRPRCICARLNAEDEAYFAEPPDMAARENGNFF
ncbi:hypothetical protein ACH4RG_23090 [Streptomyces sp. NPDC021019]|uniref:hypothetical protein n=1 Tax=Streptomyces sp. NPDC021019 TaxID=3365108 RepID=UPI0037B5DDD4